MSDEKIRRMLATARPQPLTDSEQARIERASALASHALERLAEHRHEVQTARLLELWAQLGPDERDMLLFVANDLALGGDVGNVLEPLRRGDL